MTEAPIPTPEITTKKILIVDDDAFFRGLTAKVFVGIRQVVELDSTNMDVEQTVEAIRGQLEGVTDIVLDGQYASSGTVTQVVTALKPELDARRISVIAYSGTDSVLKEFQETFPDQNAFVKPVSRNVLISALGNDDRNAPRTKTI